MSGRVFMLPILKMSRAFLGFTLMLSSTSIAMAGDLFSYAGLSYNRAMINIDDFGATSIEDEDNTFRIFAASRLYKSLYLEYGYQDLGDYTASYDYNVGNFRFVESHKVDFSQSLYASFVFQSSIAEILEAFSMNPALEKVYLRIGAGGSLWKADVEMDGEVYDTGTLLDPYGATGDDYGLSSFYEFGLGYRAGEKILLTFSVETHVDVGEGVELELADGGTQEFDGRNVEKISLGISYIF
jgi:hypothetical protein